MALAPALSLPGRRAVVAGTEDHGGPMVPGDLAGDKWCRRSDERHVSHVGRIPPEECPRGRVAADLVGMPSSLAVALLEALGKSVFLVRQAGMPTSSMFF